MAAVNFYLKNTKAKSETLIYLFFSFENKRLKYSTGEKIAPKKWNAGTQRARLTFTGADELNSYLDTVQDTVKQIYLKGKAGKVRLNPDLIREQLNKALDKNQVAEKSFYDYLDEYLIKKEVKFSPNTTKKYNTLAMLLKEFNPKLTFDKINYSFYEDLISHLISVKRHLNPTIDKYIGALKSFLNWTIQRGYNQNTESAKFSLTTFGIRYEPSPIPLTEDELQRLADFDFTANKRLERVRDAYCFACYTGLRISDFKRIERANIKKDIIVMHSQKTKSQLEVPLVMQSKELLEKYHYNFPKISEQRFNDYIKEACEQAGITDEWICTHYRGKERIEKKAPKFEFITAHTGRDTFITKMLINNTPPHVVISYTGHKDIEMLKPYLKLVDTVKVNYMKKAFEGVNNFVNPVLKKAV